MCHTPFEKLFKIQKKFSTSVKKKSCISMEFQPIIAMITKSVQLSYSMRLDKHTHWVYYQFVR